MDAAREGRAAYTASMVVAAIGLLASLGTTPLRVGAQERPYSLEGLVVTAAPTALDDEAVASHATVLDADDLARTGSPFLADALRSVSGVHVVRSGSFGGVTSLFLRGGESDYTLVLVDGVQVNQPGGGFDFAELPTDAVERVEIIRGPASALYGSDAVTGVIHVITRSGRGRPVATASFTAGSFGRRDVSTEVRGGSERASYGISVARHRMDGVYAFNSGSARTALSGVARLRPDDRTTLSINVRFSDRTHRFPTDGSGAVVDRNAFTFADQATAGVSALRALTPALSVELAYRVNELDGGTDDAVDGPADTLGFYAFTSLDHFRRVAAELRTHVRVDSWTVTAGVEREREEQRSFNASSSQFGRSSGRSESVRENTGWFVHGTGRAGPLALQGGGRVDDNDRFGVGVTWQAGVAVPVTASTRARASVGSAIKEPTFFENYAAGFVVGNPRLDPERSRSWEVGLESRLGGWLDAGVSYFDQSFEDLIQYTATPPEPGDPNYFNVAAAASRGVELDVDGRLGRWSGGGSATWMDTEVTDAGFDSGAGAGFVEGEALLRRPRLHVSLRAGVALGRVDLSGTLLHVGSRHDRDFSTFPAAPVTLDPYDVVAVRLGWRAVETTDSGPSLTLELHVDNMLDAGYEELFGFRGPGRGLYLGGRLSLGGG